MSGYLGGILSRHLGLVPVVRPRTGGYFGPPRPRAVWPIATDATPAVETRGPRVGEVEHSARRGELQAVRPAMPAKWRRPGGRHTKSTSPADAPRPEPAGPRADRVAVAAPEADYGDRADEIGVPTLATAATAPAASPLRQAHSPPTVGPRARPSRTAPPAVVAERRRALRRTPSATPRCAACDTSPVPTRATASRSAVRSSVRAPSLPARSRGPAASSGPSLSPPPRHCRPRGPPLPRRALRRTPTANPRRAASNTNPTPMRPTESR